MKVKTTTKWMLAVVAAAVLCVGTLVAVPMYESRNQPTTRWWPPVCPPIKGESQPVILIPNPDNCSEFWECDNGVPILIECPDGLYFCSEKASCSWTWDPECVFNCVAR